MRPAPTETANAAAAPTGKGPQARPARPPKADAFKGALARAMEEFLARGGKVQEVEPNVVADPPKKPDSKYGSRPI